MTFEAALEALEAVVARMEGGELTLEASLEEFEQGMKLSRQCQAMLEEARQRVHVLTRKNELEVFDGHPSDDK